MKTHDIDQLAERKKKKKKDSYLQPETETRASELELSFTQFFCFLSGNKSLQKKNKTYTHCTYFLFYFSNYQNPMVTRSRLPKCTIGFLLMKSSISIYLSIHYRPPTTPRLECKMYKTTKKENKVLNRSFNWRLTTVSLWSVLLQASCVTIVAKPRWHNKIIRPHSFLTWWEPMRTIEGVHS